MVLVFCCDYSVIADDSVIKFLYPNPMLQEKQGELFLRVVLNKYFLIGQLFCFLIKLKKEEQSF